MSFLSNWHKWPFKRSSREFRIYVVEPNTYAPKDHRAVFDSVITELFFPVSDQTVDCSVTSDATPSAEPDLIVFPEAFLSAADLEVAMNGFSQLKSQCCVHVGLRPDYASETHLFSLVQIRKLISVLKNVSSLKSADLVAFEKWALSQKDGYFNLGCVFLVDAKHCLRICLHPKWVKARVEYSVASENHMKEANLLSLITLYPSNRKHLAVTIQPLLCSDVLSLPRDSMGPNPIKAFGDSAASKLPHLPADHVDIVSLSLCTPVNPPSGASNRRRWRKEFEAAFVAAAKHDECFRHHFASFALANFGSINGADAGLSGVFVPAPLAGKSLFAGISMWSHGKHEQYSEGLWNCGTHLTPLSPDIVQKSRAYLACIDAPGKVDESIAKVFGFSLSRLVRDNPVGDQYPGLTKMDIRVVHDKLGASIGQS